MAVFILFWIPDAEYTPAFRSIMSDPFVRMNRTTGLFHAGLIGKAGIKLDFYGLLTALLFGFYFGVVQHLFVTLEQFRVCASCSVILDQQRDEVGLYRFDQGRVRQNLSPKVRARSSSWNLLRTIIESISGTQQKRSWTRTHLKQHEDGFLFVFGPRKC
jgi:hypothetical protein